MCCFFTILVFLGPRIAAPLWWLVQPARWNAAFSNILWPILGIIFVPWTTIMYVIVVPGRRHRPGLAVAGPGPRCRHRLVGRRWLPPPRAGLQRTVLIKALSGGNYG